MAPRTTLVGEVLIDAAPEHVWAAIGATGRYAEWVVNTLAVTRADGPRAEPGITYDERNRIAGPWTGRSRWRVASAEAPRHTVHEGEGIALARALRLELTLTPEAAGTRYGHELSYEPTLGALGAAVGRAVRPLLARDVRSTAQNLRALVERERTG